MSIRGLLLVTIQPSIGPKVVAQRTGRRAYDQEDGMFDSRRGGSMNFHLGIGQARDWPNS